MRIYCQKCKKMALADIELKGPEKDWLKRKFIVWCCGNVISREEAEKWRVIQKQKYFLKDGSEIVKEEKIIETKIVKSDIFCSCFFPVVAPAKDNFCVMCQKRLRL